MSGNKTRAGQPRGTQILTDSAKNRENVVMNSKCNKWRISIEREIERLNTFKTNNCLKSDSKVLHDVYDQYKQLIKSVFLVISGSLHIL